MKIIKLSALCLGVIALSAAVSLATTTWAVRHPTSIQLVNLTSNLALDDGPPANHERIVFGATWDQPVDHAENSPVDCLTEEAITLSQCRAVVDVKAPKEATHAILKVKVKSWILRGGDPAMLNYSLIYARAPSDIGIANHFIHTEAWGGGPDGTEERRRVEYTNVFIPIVNGTITLEVGKQINGNSLVEISVYLAGYVSGDAGEPSLVSELQ